MSSKTTESLDLEVLGSILTAVFMRRFFSEANKIAAFVKLYNNLYRYFYFRRSLQKVFKRNDNLYTICTNIIKRKLFFLLFVCTLRAPKLLKALEKLFHYSVATHIPCFIRVRVAVPTGPE